MNTKTKNRRYWRSLDELHGTEAFAEAEAKEFADKLPIDFEKHGGLSPEVPEDGGAQIATGGGQTRRGFMGAVGMGVAAAGLAGCVRRPEDKILPYSKAPEDLVPGVPQFYATAAQVNGRAMGLIVESHEGRPTKIEGHPEHTSSFGACAAPHLAQIHELYDPSRLTRPVVNGESVDWAAGEAALKKTFEALRASKGQGLAIIAGAKASPTLDALRKRVLQGDLNQAKWFTYEGISEDNQRAGIKAVLGTASIPQYRFDRARVLVSFDSDFLHSEGESVRNGKLWGATRDIERLRKMSPAKQAENMSRLYAVEGLYSTTGTNAEHRLRVPASRVEAIAWAVAKGLKDGKAAFAVGTEKFIDQYGAAKLSEEEAKFVKVLVADLLKARKRAIVFAGRRQSPAVHALAVLINGALAAHGSLVQYYPDTRRPVLEIGDADNLKRLVEGLNSGKFTTVINLGTNPLFTAPGDVKVAEAFAKAKTRITFSHHAPQVKHVEEFPNQSDRDLEAIIDETAAASTHVFPRAHFLESWGDITATDGTVSIQQPLIDPIFGAKADVEVLAMLLGDEKTSSHDVVRGAWKQKLGSNGFFKAWRKMLHDGVVAERVFTALTAQPGMPAGSFFENRPTPKTPSKDALEVIFYETAHMWDGRFGGNGWMMETPDNLTKITWDNAALLSPATAEALGVANEQEVEVTVNGASVKVPAWILPGLAANTVALAVGFGRYFNSYLTYHASGPVGANVNPMRTAANPDIAFGATLKSTGNAFKVACVQRYGRQAGYDPEVAPGYVDRPLVRENTIAGFAKKPDFAKPGIIEHGKPFPQGAPVVHPPTEAIYKEHDYSKGYQWGMAIDLTKCTGCNACLVACQAENSIPPVGKDQVMRGRELHWIRMDRYFEGDAENPRVLHQPLNCQQCENAPCENVCPVAATVHSPEGLNDMVYNRCIGTRYCSNNCPFKVRRFNFYNYTKSWPELIQMARNPNVTVRFRGVMEKCTYCVQRINKSKLNAKLAPDDRKAKSIMDNLTTACAQACPSGAIVFGDINNKGSAVTKAKARERDYTILSELNLKNRTSFLAKISNPNPELEG
ncbi:MAG: TAT-variant-translocated molybdopterin oxidoreductase [Bradymonadia bacterium]